MSQDLSFITELMDDISESFELMQANPESIFYRRVYVRSVFAHIEGFLDFSKNFILFVHQQKPPGLPEVENWKYQYLLGESYRVDHVGKLANKPDKIFPPLKNYTALIIRSLHDLDESDPSAWFSDNRFGLYSEAIKIRDRITHPKDSTELALTIEHIGIVSHANAWVSESLNRPVMSLMSKHNKP